MKRTLALSVLLLVLGGCTSEYNRCVESEAKKLEVTPEVAEIRAENICYQEPVYFQNQEETFQAMLEEEICIDKHIQKILLEAKNYESKAHDICTMRIFDKDFQPNKR